MATWEPWDDLEYLCLFKTFCSSPVPNIFTPRIARIDDAGLQLGELR